MIIRKSTITDLPRIREIFGIARDFMRRSGNPSQWKGNYPSDELLLSDIENGVSYVITHNESIIGTFAFIVGDDPTYAEIDGGWLNDQAYGTNHRLASDGSIKGVADHCLEYCKSIINNIRIDTHRDNTIMLNWISRAGFKPCGIIHISDGTPRQAFQLMPDAC